MVVSSASTGTLRALLNTLIYLWLGQLIIAPMVSGTSNLSPQDGYNDAMDAVEHKRVKRSGECYNTGEECTGDKTGLTGSCYLVGDSNIPSDTEPEESSHCQGPECNCWVTKTDTNISSSTPSPDTTPEPTISNPVIEACNTRGGHIIGDECIIFSTENESLSWQEANEMCWWKHGPLASPKDPKALHDFVAKNFLYNAHQIGASWDPVQCPFVHEIALLIKKLDSLEACMQECTEHDDCTALEYNTACTTNDNCCRLRYCPFPTPEPTAVSDSEWRGYSVKQGDSQFWVGGYSLQNSKSFKWLNGGQIPLDSTKFPWAQSEPSYPAGEQLCLGIDGKKGYFDQRCSSTHRYACSLGKCAMRGGTTLGYQCVVFREEEETWNSATDICAQEEGQLLVPAYPKYFAELIFKDPHTYSTPVWVGGIRTDPTKEESLYWVNGQEISRGSVPWHPSNDKRKGKDCIEVRQEKNNAYYGNADCKDIRRFFCELGVVSSSTEASDSVLFHFKQSSSGKFIGPDVFFPYVEDGAELILHPIIDPNLLFALDIIDEQWGYIRHIQTGKIVTPEGGFMDPSNGTKCILHNRRRPWALFSLDQYQNRIIHRSGKFVTTDGFNVVISAEENSEMDFKFVITRNQKEEEVLPYGYATISGDWVLVFSVLNPLATHTYESKVSTGRSESQSTQSNFKYGFEIQEKAQSSFTASQNWEIGTTAEASATVEAGFNVGIASGSASASVSASISGSYGGGTDQTNSHEETETSSLVRDVGQADSSTWNSEETTTLSFKVEAGQSVAVWQRVFIAKKGGRRAVHLSNIFANTNSSRINPNNFNRYQNKQNV